LDDPSTHDGRGFAAPVFGCHVVVRRYQLLLASLSDEDYGRVRAGTASVGEHVRHTIEHFTALIDEPRAGVVRYDARPRSRILEEDRRRAIAVLRRVEAQLLRHNRDDLWRPVSVELVPFPNGAPLRSQSSFARELMFVASHGIHHLALIAEILEAHGIGGRVPDHFSFATPARKAAESVGAGG